MDSVPDSIEVHGVKCARGVICSMLDFTVHHGYHVIFFLQRTQKNHTLKDEAWGVFSDFIV